MTHSYSRHAAYALSALAAASLLAACDRGDNRAAGERSDSVVAQADRGAREMGSSARQAAGETGDKAKDMAITAKLKSQLAADDGLKATQINVDTNAGQVTLRGSAPDAAAKERATQLARGVSGVVEVDNQLSVKQQGG